MGNTQYKGFAYTKEGNKPTAVYGTSVEDILAKLNSYNIARTEKDKFVACNIGSLNEETSKYEDYHRYEVATGKDITAIYLNIPPLQRDEFRKVTADLKAAGAKFNPNKKAWYVTAEHAGLGQELQAYLDSLNAKAKEQPEEAQLPTDEEKTDFIIEGIEVQYAVRTQDQQIVMIPESELNMLNIKGTPDELLEKLNEKAVEQLRLKGQDIPNPERIADESEYTVSISKQHENRCTIWFNDGREPIEINGYEHGVTFPEMNANSVADFVAEYLENMDQPGRSIRLEYHEGDAIDCYVPLRLQNISPYQPIYIENVSHVVGQIVGNIGTIPGTDVKTYDILQEGGELRTIRSDEIYAPDQARVLLRAAADELTGVQFDLLADRNLSAAQMEEIRFGFKDGLTAEQVALYANPNMTPAEMDLCRIGLNSRLDYVEISRLLKETKELSWTDSRNRLNEAIKDHRVIEESRKAAHEAGLPFSEKESTEEAADEASEPAEIAYFYGIQVPVVEGKRVISQAEINQLREVLYEYLPDRLPSVERLYFTDCIFQNVDFNVFNIYGNPLIGADFSGSKFYDCKFGDPGRIGFDLRECRFRDASFSDTSFRNTILKQCDFQKASLSNCRFRSSDVIDVDFSEANLKRTIFENCAMENNSFWKTGMDGVDVYESCSIMDQKYISTISYTMGGATREEMETMKERVLWQLSGEEVPYKRMKELQKLFQSEKEGSLDSENTDWRLDLSRDEEELVDQWDKQYTKAMEEKSSSTKAAPEKEGYHDKTYGGKRSVVNLLHEKKSMVSTSAVENAHEDKIRKAEALTK